MIYSVKEVTFGRPGRDNIAIIFWLSWLYQFVSKTFYGIFT